jgi:hypothetical protein
MKDNWTLGPKFKDYLAMNFRLVVQQYVFILLLSVIGMGMFGYLLLIPALTKLYSQTLYHKQACLYQSVPVSSFETVLVKTVVGAIGFLLPAVGSLMVNLVFSALGGSWKFKLYEIIKTKGMMSHVPAGAALYVLEWVALAFLLCGIALFGVAVGNRMRGNRDKRPNAGTAVLVIAGLLLIVYGILWILEQIQFASPLLRESMFLAFSIVGASLMFWINVRALDRWYSI